MLKVNRGYMAAGIRKVTFVDAFAGCGGLSLGLMQAGCKGLFAIEKDKYAFETLQHNLLSKDSRFKFAWPNWLAKKRLSMDTLLSKHAAELRLLAGKVDVLVGGPPCQGFSSAGRRQHDDPRNKLFRAYLKLVSIVQPRAVLIENVRGFTMNFDNGERIHNYASKLREALSQDYDVYDQLMDLSGFGVPQRRTRFFLLALRRGLCDGNPFDHLRRSLPSYLRSQGLQAPVSTWAAISDLEISRKGRCASRDTEGFDEIDYDAPITHYQRLMNADTRRPTNTRLARHADEIRERFAEIIEVSHAQGRLNTSIPDELRQQFNIKKKALRVLDPDRPSPTVTSMPDDLLHYSEPRTLTVRENARLQSFPDWYEFKGKYTTGGHLRKREVPRFTQVANAVPPLAARAFGELLIKMLNEKQYRPTSKSRIQNISKRPELAAQA